MRSRVQFSAGAFLLYFIFICKITFREEKKTFLSKLEKSKKGAQEFYKKSSILSMNKNIVEVKDSHFIEMPLYKEGNLLLAGDLSFLRNIINSKLEEMWN